MSKLLRITAILLVLLLPAATMQAEIQGAMLYAKGVVRVNGVATLSSAPIKAGDALQTSADGTAQIVAEGSFVQVQPASSVVYNRSSITVQQGLATIATAKNLTGSVSSLRVSPLTAGGVRFALRNEAGRVQVAALMGSVRVNGANNLNVTLKTGEVYTLDQDSNGQGTGPSVPSAPNPQTGTGPVITDDNALIFGISAAVIAGVVLGLINAASVSPAGP